MITQLTNKSIYSNQEFRSWAGRADGDLIAVEKYLIEKYLKNNGGEVIEAGTGGGRIAFNIEKMGFSNITAFDYVLPMIEAANQHKLKRQSNINFLTLDATDLSTLRDGSFDYLIYLQQVICFIPKEFIEKALAESYRIAKDGAISIFSFLLWEGRSFNAVLSILLNVMRLLRGEPISRQSLPWLRFDNKLNWSFFKKGQATNYWFKRDEISLLIKKSGYFIMECGTAGEILNLKNNNSKMLYIVCRK